MPKIALLTDKWIQDVVRGASPLPLFFGQPKVMVKATQESHEAGCSRSGGLDSGCPNVDTEMEDGDSVMGTAGGTQVEERDRRGASVEDEEMY